MIRPRRSLRHFPMPSYTGMVALLATIVVVLTGCAIGTDDSPRDLVVSTTTTAVPLTPTNGEAQAVLYYLRDGQLVPASLSLPDHGMGTALNALFKTPNPKGTTRDLTTSIPAGTRLNSQHLEGGTLSLDLSSEFDNVVGPSRQQAIAQIVMTATEFPDVDRVRFSVGGKGVQVATPTHGDTAVVTDCDYRSLLIKQSDVDGTTLDPATAQRLKLRQENLRQSCPADN